MKKGLIIYTIYSLIMIFIGYSINIDTSRQALNEINNSFVYLFLNNIKVELVTILIGIITIGIGALLMSSFNFLLLGAAVRILTKEMTLTNAIKYIIPHGVLEIPAMIITGFLGIYIPYKIIQGIRTKEFKGNKIIKLIIILLVLTFIAAVVENFITPYFI